MVFEIFVKQLDGCTYVSGGQNCTCASEAMWLYRASQGKIHTSACAVRKLTNDKSAGTNLGQMEQVSINYGITAGRVYRPASWETIESVMASNRYGMILQISYRSISGTAYDCFSGRFKGNHAYFVSGKGAKAGTWRVGDPGADGRRSGIPNGYQDIPVSLLKRAAGYLDLGGTTLGYGKAYAYVTPPDPSASSPKYHAQVTTTTSLWNNGTKKWVYSVSSGNGVPVGTQLIVRGANYTFDGVVCYPIDASSPHYPNYYVPKAHVKLGARA